MTAEQSAVILIISKMNSVLTAINVFCKCDSLYL